LALQKGLFFKGWKRLKSENSIAGLMLLFSALKKERVKEFVYLPVFASCFAFFAAFFFFRDGIILPCSSYSLSLKDFSKERATSGMVS